MIEPPIDPETATDEQLVAAYMRDGMSRKDAEDYVAAIRIASDEFPLG